MEILSIPKEQLYQRLRCLDMNSTVKHQFFSLFMKWLQNNGPEWTVTRIKSVKQDILMSCSDSNHVLNTVWVSKKDKHTFSGVFGSIQRIALSSDSGLEKVITLLNIYTSVVSPKLLASQERKFKKAVTTPAPPSNAEYMALTEQVPDFLVDKRPVNPADTILNMSKGKPSHEKRIFSEILQYFSSDAGRYCMTHFDKVVCPSIVKALPHKRDFRFNDCTIGTIGLTQSPGLKARFYAAPHIWIQHALTPIGRRIYSLVKTLPWDCTFEQEKGFPAVQQALKQGQTLYCFDLSSATDRFPLDLQMSLLRHTFIHDTAQNHLDFYEWLNRQPWKFYGNDSKNDVKPNEPYEEISWVRGQPLGMFPSFGSFTYTHGYMLYALNGFQHDNKFFVLGDDVIILDKSLAMRYEKFLIDLSIDYEPNKTIMSSRFGEFAGRIIFRDSILQSRKWKPIHQESIMDFLKNWGPDFKSIIKDARHPLFDKVASLPEPLGLGWNPLGLSLDVRLEGLEELLVKEDTPMEYLTSVRTLNLERLRSVDMKYYYRNLAEILQVSDTFDQKVLDDYSDLLPTISKEFFNIAGKNLYSVNPELNLPITTKPANARKPKLVNRIQSMFAYISEVLLQQ